LEEVRQLEEGVQLQN
jgi:hypothetical protein